jgi:WD40 repeat protein
MSYYHSHAKLGLTIEAGSFVGGESEIMVAGSSGKHLNVKYFDYKDGELHCESSNEVASKSSCTSMEVCGDQMDGKAYVALALVGGRNDGSSTLSLHDFTAAADRDDGDNDASPVVVPHEYAISALSFSSDQRVLGAASECGTVSLYDFPLMEAFRKLRVDACGVNDAVFDRNGQLVIAGRSAVMGPQIWDIRLPDDQARVLAMGPDAALFGGGGGGGSGVRGGVKPGVLTCVQPHVVKNTVYAGSEDGVVSEWDVRNAVRPVDSVRMHHDRVTALVLHPTRSDAVVSGSTDGSVQAVFLDDSVPGFSFELESPIVALDVHEVSGRLLVASALGGLDLFHFEE